jgi:hypothetical protein
MSQIVNALSYKLDFLHHTLSLAFKQALRTAEDLSYLKQIRGSNDVRTKCQTHKLTMIKQFGKHSKTPERQNKKTPKNPKTKQRPHKTKNKNKQEEDSKTKKTKKQRQQKIS